MFDEDFHRSASAKRLIVKKAYENTEIVKAADIAGEPTTPSRTRYHVIHDAHMYKEK